MLIPLRLRQPIAKIGFLLNLLSLGAMICQRTVAAQLTLF